MDKIALNLEPRTVKGKAVKKLRRDGLTPAVVYGHDLQPVAVSVDTRALDRVYDVAGSNKLVSVKIGEAAAKNALIYDLQRHPRTGLLAHVDFYVVKMDEKIKTEVPIHFTGEAPAVYQQDGTLLKNLEMVEVEALPGDLPEAIEVNLDDLDDFEKSISVADLKVPAGVDLLVEPETLVVKVEPPRSDEELAELEAAVTEELPEGVAEENAEVVAEENEGNKDKQDQEAA